MVLGGKRRSMPPTSLRREHIFFYCWCAQSLSTLMHVFATMGQRIFRSLMNFGELSAQKKRSVSSWWLSDWISSWIFCCVRGWSLSVSSLVRICEWYFLHLNINESSPPSHGRRNGIWVFCYDRKELKSYSLILLEQILKAQSLETVCSTFLGWPVPLNVESYSIYSIFE